MAQMIPRTHTRRDETGMEGSSVLATAERTSGYGESSSVCWMVNLTRGRQRCETNQIGWHPCRCWGRRSPQSHPLRSGGPLVHPTGEHTPSTRLPRGPRTSFLQVNLLLLIVDGVRARRSDAALVRHGSDASGIHGRTEEGGLRRRTQAWSACTVGTCTPPG